MKVYYNESCSICRAEINLYKKQNIKEIEWIDITSNKLAEKDTYKNDKALLRRLHVKEGEKVFEGAKAFLLVWKKIPKYKFLYYFFKLPIVFQIFSFGYEIIAYFLYLKNKKQLKNY
tara:strand:+ start:199 stop:549 length:351 start_codon:yes stop_codon:yes gene_type:complete